MTPREAGRFMGKHFRPSAAVRFAAELPEGKRKAFWRAYRAQRHALGLPRHGGQRSPSRKALTKRLLVQP